MCTGGGSAAALQGRRRGSPAGAAGRDGLRAGAEQAAAALRQSAGLV